MFSLYTCVVYKWVMSHDSITFTENVMNVFYFSAILELFQQSGDLPSAKHMCDELVLWMGQTCSLSWKIKPNDCNSIDTESWRCLSLENDRQRRQLSVCVVTFNSEDTELTEHESGRRNLDNSHSGMLLSKVVLDIKVWLGLPWFASI